MPILLHDILNLKENKTSNDLRKLIPQFVNVAQKVYDEWDQSDIENDPLNGGGICQDIAEEIVGVLSNNGIDSTTIDAQIGDQHVWAISKVEDGVYEIDIPHQFMKQEEDILGIKFPE